MVISGNIFFWDTGSHVSRGHVVFFFFIGNMGHRVTKLGHVCDPIVTSITLVTIVHGSQGHAGHVGHAVFFFSRNAFSRVTGTRHTRRSHLALFCLIMSHICVKPKGNVLPGPGFCSLT